MRTLGGQGNSTGDCLQYINLYRRRLREGWNEDHHISQGGTYNTLRVVNAILFLSQAKQILINDINAIIQHSTNTNECTECPGTQRQGK